VKWPSKITNQQIRISVLFISLIIITFIPFETVFNNGQSVCIHYNLLGIQCPLCGMTRAVHQFMHLQFASAMQYNPVVALLPLYLVTDVTTLFYQKDWMLMVKKIIVVLICAALVLLYAYRINQYFNLV
jgi:hypothetical protein